MSDFDFDLLSELVDDAPVAGFGPQVNFGKCTMEVIINSWDNDAKKFNTRPFVKGEQLKQGEYLQITFKVDVTELNPALTNEYKRRVDVKKSGNKAKTDWSETVEPSLVSVFGKEWTKRIGKGVYVQIEDAETVEVNRQGELKGWDKDGKHYTNTVPRFLAAFKSKAECETARAERFQRKENGSTPEALSENVINKVRTIMGYNLSEDQLRDLLKAEFPSHDPDELIAAVNPLYRRWSIL
jgi:hypothetical protein